MMENESKRVGRPKSENPKNCQYRLRLTKEEYEKLELLAEKREKTMSGVIREALKILEAIEEARK